MYDELVAMLRKCATEAAACKTCELDNNPDCSDYLMKQAADAIEFLRTYKTCFDNIVRMGGWWLVGQDKNIRVRSCRAVRKYPPSGTAWRTWLRTLLPSSRQRRNKHERMA